MGSYGSLLASKGTFLETFLHIFLLVLLEHLQSSYIPHFQNRRTSEQFVGVCRMWFKHPQL